MPEIKDNSFDVVVIDNIRKYISDNDLSLGKIAEASGIRYISLWQIFNRNSRISLSQYVSLCHAFDEPLDRFLPEQLK